MMVANNNSFDLWQKDAFFAAAEEVQESADAMESAYRMWLRLREKRDAVWQNDFHQLCRELQTALGTAKWQLEEFERAVKLSYGNGCDTSTATRHGQFVAAIESQISRVEASLRDAVNEEGKEPFRWVNLDREENDDLAMFLSGSSQSFQQVDQIWGSYHERTDGPSSVCDIGNADGTKGYKDVTVPQDSGSDHIVHITDIPGLRDDAICHVENTSGLRRPCSSPNFGALKIVVSDESKQITDPSSIEVTPKDKRLKPYLWRQRCGEHFLANGSINLFNKVFGRSIGFQHQKEGAMPLKFVRSIRVTLALMLSIFLIVPFLFYSS